MDAVDAALLERLELALARRDEELAGAPLEDLLDPEFAEHGASGRRWSRDEIAALLGGGSGSLVDLHEVIVDEVAPGVALVTYRSSVADAPALAAWRSSLWLRTDAGWRIRFHQGTRTGGAGA